MKKVFNYSILTTLALLLTLSGCVGDNILYPDYDGEDRTVSLRFATTETTTRGVSRPVCDGEPVQFNGGDLYLVRSTGIIYRHFQVVPVGDPAATNIANGIINFACLNTGVTMDVPGNVNRVVLVGNNLPLNSLPTVGNINSVISRTVDAYTQVNVWDVWRGVNMFANELLVHCNTDNVWVADMVLAPIVARFEVGQITGMGMIESFSLQGIYIDRHFGRATLDGNFHPAGAQPVVRGSANSAVNFALNAPHYTSAFSAGDNVGRIRNSGALFTVYNPALPAAARTPDGVIMRPGLFHNPSADFPYTWGAEGCLVGCCPPGTTVDRVWNFQMFARDYARPGTSPMPPANTTPPVLVIRLTDVVIRTDVGTETQNIGTQYLTVANFNRRNPDGTFSPLTGIRASNVYRIHNLVFDERDLHYTPNVRPMTAAITVELAEWDGRPTEHDGFRQLNPIGGAAVNGAFAFPLGAAFNGGCTGDNSMVYLWQRSTNPNVWAEPNRNDAVTEPDYSVTGLTVTTYFRRVAWCACGARSISTVARVTVVPNTLTATQVIIFPGTVNGGGISHPVTINTNAPSWSLTTSTNNNFTVQTDGVTSGGTGTTVINVTIQATQNDNPQQREERIFVTAPGAQPVEVRVIQLPSGNYEPFFPPLQDAFVGAFWRNNQRGERLIRMPNPATDPPHNTWTAVAIDSWIVLDDQFPAQFPPTTNITPGQADTPLLPGTASSTVTGTGEFRFRIGLIGQNPNGLGPAAAPRYGQVALFWGPNEDYIHIIWVRQGERADYLMHREHDNRTFARQLSPFNLTGGLNNYVPYFPGSGGIGNNRWSDLTSLNGGVLAHYPTQTGAFFHFSRYIGGTGNRVRRAFTPRAISITGAAPYGTTASWGVDAPGDWGGVGGLHEFFETCPPGYRRPNDGSTVGIIEVNVNRANSELRQSLMLEPTITGLGGNISNSVRGFYADGFFDRRMRTTNTGGNPTGANPRLTTVAHGTVEIAHRGTLIFNPRSRASLFVPASGLRSSTEITAVGNIGIMMSTSRAPSTGGPPTPFPYHPMIWGFRTDSSEHFMGPWTHQRSQAQTIRCVREVPWPP